MSLRYSQIEIIDRWIYIKQPTLPTEWHDILNVVSSFGGLHLKGDAQLTLTVLT